MAVIDDLARLYAGQSTGRQISPELAARLAQEEQNANMAGQSAFGEIGALQAGSDLLEFLSRLHFSGQSQRAQDLAAESGIPEAEWKSAMEQRNAETRSSAPWAFEKIGRAGNYVKEHPAVLLAPAAIAGIAGAFGAGAAGGTAGGTAAPVAGAAKTFPLATTGGSISVTPLASSAAAAGASMPNWLNWANLGSTVLGVVGAERAADAQVGASNAAVDESRRQFETARGDLKPTIELGGTAATLLRRYLEGDRSVYTQSPGYQDQVDEAQKAIDRSASARGKVLSGPSVREGIRYGTSLASLDHGSFVDRLLAAAGLGTTGAAASANAGSNSAAQVGASRMFGGNARASGYANMYGALQGGVQNVLLQRYLGGP